MEDGGRDGRGGGRRIHDQPQNCDDDSLRRCRAVSHHPFSEVITGTKHFLKDRPLFLTVAGISYFWFLGALLQMDLLLVGSEYSTSMNYESD